MKIVNHALKIFRDPQVASPEPTYDPVTNTKFIYKWVLNIQNIFYYSNVITNILYYQLNYVNFYICFAKLIDQLLHVLGNCYTSKTWVYWNLLHYRSKNIDILIDVRQSTCTKI